MCTERLQARPFHVQAAGRAWAREQRHLRDRKPSLQSPLAAPKVGLECHRGWEAHCLSCHLYTHPVESHPHSKTQKDVWAENLYPTSRPTASSTKGGKGDLQPCLGQEVPMKVDPPSLAFGDLRCLQTSCPVKCEFQIGNG